MLTWLIAICLFWVIGALYLGGMNVEIEGGGGFRQTTGLLVTFVLYLVVWTLLRRLLGDLGPFVGEILLPTVASILAIPLLARAGFRLLGVRVRRGTGHPHGTGAAHH